MRRYSKREMRTDDLLVLLLEGTSGTDDGLISTVHLEGLVLSLLALFTGRLNTLGEAILQQE